MQTNTILQGDIRQLARTLPDGSVHCIVTSPPYYGLRDYGTAEWEGGRADCDHKTGRDTRGGVTGKQASNNGSFDDEANLICPKCGATRKDAQIGLEASPQEYVDTLVGILRELRRVLRDDGSLWLNLGDSYANTGNKGQDFSASKVGYGGKGRGHIGGQPIKIIPDGLKPKDLIGIPWRVALALQSDGWWLRSDIIWAKPSPMPESVTDRPTKAHEYIFLLSKSPRYYYDQEAVREPFADDRMGNPGTNGTRQYAPGDRQDVGRPMAWDKGAELGGRNRRTVWVCASKPYPHAHFATFPPDLIRPCILAGCPERVCAECGAPWVRVVEKTGKKIQQHWAPGTQDKIDKAQGRHGDNSVFNTGFLDEKITVGFRPTCTCYDHLYRNFPKPRNARKLNQRLISGDWWRRVRQRPGLDSWPSEPGIVFDPFLGSGTVGEVATQEGRRWLGCELNADYIELARDRINKAKVMKVAGKEYYEAIKEKPDSALEYKQLGLIGDTYG